MSLSECSDLFFANGCGLHDVQNALKWCLEPLLKGDMLSDMHIILESLRSNAQKLLQVLPKHLLRTVVERDPEQIAGLEDRRQFWSLLGVEASMLDKLQDLDPWFHNGTLLVNPLETGTSEDLEQLSAAVMYLMRWRCFTESRFLSMAEAATGFLGSMCCGLTVLAAELSATGSGVGTLQGLQRLKPDIVKCFVVLAVVGATASEIQVSMMADDRLLRHQEELLSVLYEEAGVAHSLPDLVWERLALLVGEECQPQVLPIRVPQRTACCNCLCT